MAEPTVVVRPDRLVHEPARLAILVVLAAVEEADFLFLLDQTGLTKGNLSSHTARLADGGYVDVHKSIADRTTRTVYSLTEQGEQALRAYKQHMTDVLDGVT